MRILHISDLHIGAHNPNLLGSLRTRVRSLKPDVILATGDFADLPYMEHLQSALDYLIELRKQCPDRSDGPSLIVVPGNHDKTWFGNVPAFKSTAKYSEVFKGLPTGAFYPKERVWIYGFDSARETGLGSNGEVETPDINSFDQVYQDAREQYKADFDGWYKIVALHHHPLPIRYSSKYSRWVTLLNAAEFLEQMLKHNIDLIVHGHEHVHAQATFGKRFLQRDNGVTVISVGTVFHKDPGSDNNRFNIIQISPTGQVEVESYEAKGGTFDERPVDSYTVRTTSESETRRFNQTVTEKGYKYDSLVARTEINLDGDALRMADFNNLTLKDANSDRAKRHHVSLPQTSGYIDRPTAWEITDGNTKKELVFRRADVAAGDKRVDGVIEYGRSLSIGMQFSLRCRWWAVNAMAMSKSQSLKKYVEPRFVEYTHFPILDPVEQLVCTLNFPPALSPYVRPEPFVARVSDRQGSGLHVEERDAAMEHQLRGSIVVDLDGARATLRITRPRIGYTYGFQWAVPDDDDHGSDETQGETADIVEGLLQLRRAKDAGQSSKLIAGLGAIAELLRATLAPIFKRDLEFGLMVFDIDERKMVTVMAVRLTRSQIELINREHVSFEYGEGISGKAFKAKDARLYVRPDPGKPNSMDPDYYRKVEGGPDYAVLFALPIFHPKSERNVFAVLSCGSSQRSCPLRELGTNGAPVTREEVKTAQLAVSEALHKELADIFLG